MTGLLTNNTTTMEHIKAEVVRTASEACKEKGLSLQSDDQVLLEGMINSVLVDSHPMFSLLRKRVLHALRLQLIYHGSREESDSYLLRYRMKWVDDYIGSISEELKPICEHNFKVYAAYYDSAFIRGRAKLSSL